MFQSPGNVFVRYADIDEALVDPSTGAAINKVVFMIFFQVSFNEKFHCSKTGSLSL